MLTTDCPKTFWSSIARLTELRLLAYAGFDHATFANAANELVDMDRDTGETLARLHQEINKFRPGPATQ